MSPAGSRRILAVLPFTPHREAVHGGSRVAGQLLYHLADRHEIAVVYFRRRGDPELDSGLEERLVSALPVNAPERPGTVLARARRGIHARLGLLAGRPLGVGERRSSEFGRRIAAVVDHWRPDVVQVDYGSMAQYFSCVRRDFAARVLVEYDPPGSVARERHRANPRRQPLLRALDPIVWRYYEGMTARRVDAIVVFTMRDKGVVARYARGTPVVCIAPGTVLPARPLDPVGAEPPQLLFVGNFDHPPNREAVAWLIADIFPAVRARIPSCVLEIVGNRPPRWLVSNSDLGIHVAGRVPDVLPYLDRAAVAVMPLRSGGGIRVKVMEALAAGKAVVATPLALEGIAVDAGTHALVARTAPDLASRIVELLADPGRRAQIGTRARRWALDHLEWDVAVRDYEKLYARLLDAPLAGTDRVRVDMK